MFHSRRNIILAIIVASISLFGLALIQFRILNNDIGLKEELIEYSIPAILMDAHDRWNHNKSLNKLIREFEGTTQFAISNNSEADGLLQREIKKELSQTLGNNYPNLEYSLSVYISSEYGCLIHDHHNSHLSKTGDILNAENTLCLCSLGHGKTLDIGFQSSNREAVAFTAASKMIWLTLVFIVLVALVFFYMIYTINRQKKLSDLRNDFVNNLTHEFKTPIFSISLAANALKEIVEKNDKEKLHRYVGVIEHEGKRLKNQVDKILQMALIDSGNLTIDKKSINAHDLIEKVAENFRVIIEERGGSLTLNLNASNDILNADETHLKNIIYNLLDNAQKYTEENPEIEIQTIDDKNGLKISIKDNGIGMQQEVQKFVFDKFYRAPTGNIHNVKGFGLGLSYVKSIVNAHRGWISLESATNRGSKFTIYLPGS
ncbi:MAG: HAMP domain-containing sensor histidine kinase [Cyclobacteriaceae bacterium]